MASASCDDSKSFNTDVCLCYGHAQDESTKVWTPPLKDLAECVKDEDAPIAKRIRSVFYLKEIGSKEAIDALAAALSCSSVLLTHEIAFVLGQMKDPYAVPYLIQTLENKSYDPVLRHEAAEGLGAIGLAECLPLLEKYCKDEAPEVADTCILALQRIQWTSANNGQEPFSKYRTVDPAPAFANLTVAELKEKLADQSLPIFERYRAMFALRNVATPEAVEALAAGFSDSSAVLRHEIAFVMGQLQSKTAVPFLSKALQNLSEHAMVRHEAAEALGSIGDPASEVLLEEFRQDRDLIVKQSCDVALDIMDYWGQELDAERAGEEEEETEEVRKQRLKELLNM